MESAVIHFLILAAFLTALWLPAWWLVGRLTNRLIDPLLRAVLAAGLATMAYLTVLNLIGRALERSTPVALGWALACALASAILIARDPAGMSVRPLLSRWRRWVPLLFVVAVLALPQAMNAFSAPLWDEVATSALHITAPNQIADGLYPPRHNAFPDVPVKYHYASTVLVGTLVWLTGLSANVCIDLVSTSVWFFIFLLLYLWLRQLDFSRVVSLWAGFAALLGGGLAWAYSSSLATYEAFRKVGRPSEVTYAWDAGRGWLDNLIELARTPVFHLHNDDGSMSNLPWDIASQFQQHALSFGLGLSLLCGWLFSRWRADPRGPHALTWGALSALSFGLVMLGHAVVGGVTCLAAGLLLVIDWLRSPTWRNFADTVVFTVIVFVLSFAHGGMLTRGEVYGGKLVQLNLRDRFGYSEGGLSGFLDWNIAGFGVPLILALVGLGVAAARWASTGHPRRRFVLWFGAVLLVSYLPPQLLFYSYGRGATEQGTEVAKFFFATHLALGVLSALGLAVAGKRLGRLLLIPLAAATMVVPLAHNYATVIPPDGLWHGFYTSPYGPARVEIATRFRSLKSGNQEVVYDAQYSAPGRGFLSELLIFGGSVFVATPRRYENTGALAISRERVSRQHLLSKRVARLRPGAMEDAGVGWIYINAANDVPRAPLIVRSRFGALRASGTLELGAQSFESELYARLGDTSGVDDDLSQHWRPQAVLQTLHDWDGDGRGDLIFFVPARGETLIGSEVVTLPRWFSPDEAVSLLVGDFSGDGRVELHAARMADTFFWRGDAMLELTVRNIYQFVRHDSGTRTWGEESPGPGWRENVLLVSDLDGDGTSEFMGWHRDDRLWHLPGGRLMEDPRFGEREHAIPVLGRFSDPGRQDLALWRPETGEWKIRSPDVGAEHEFVFGEPGDVLVPGDYDGDGRDEVVVWRPADQTWYSYEVTTHRGTEWTFGTPTCVPLPADYDHDGRTDVAIWEPGEQRIEVSFDLGRSVGLTLEVPVGAIPAWVNMH
jgi:hypothetical protein